jgi:hypothetical protein
MEDRLLRNIQRSLKRLRGKLKKEALRLNPDLEPEVRRELQGVGMDVSAASMNLNELIRKLEGEK